MWDGHLASTKAVQHRTELENWNDLPLHSAPYRAAHKAREFQNPKIERMFPMDVLEPALPEWASPIMFVPEKDATFRFWVDY